MNELINRILTAFELEGSAEDILREMPEAEAISEIEIIEYMASKFELTEEQIREAVDSSDITIGEDPEATMRTLEDMMEARVGEPFIATTNRISRSADNNRTIVVINSDAEDRHGTIINPEGGNLENYRQNPVFLINHSYNLPAGNNSSVRMQNGQIIAEVKDDDWNDDDSTEKGREIKFWKGLVKQGKVKMASVGIMPLEIKRETREDPKTGEDREFVIIHRWELLEWSFVPVGSNPTALVMQRNLSIAGKDPEVIEKRIKDLEKQISELERLIKEIDPSDQQADGKSSGTRSTAEDASDEEEKSAADSMPYVPPRKANKTIKYIPKAKPPDEAKIARSVQEIIKRKQGKR